jgi:WD40 repeat protein
MTQAQAAALCLVRECPHPPAQPDAALARAGVSLSTASDDVLLLLCGFLDFRSAVMASRLSKRFRALFVQELPKTLYFARAADGLLGASAERQQIRWDVEARWRGLGQAPPVVATLSSHSGSVTCLAYATKDLLVSGSDDGSLAVWNMRGSERSETGTQMAMQHHLQSRMICRMHSLQGHGGAVWCVATDTGVVASGSYDKTIKLWDLASGNCFKTLRGHESWVSCLGMDVASDCIVSGGWDASVRLWSISRGQQVAVLDTTPGNSV